MSTERDVRRPRPHPVCVPLTLIWPVKGRGGSGAKSARNINTNVYTCQAQIRGGMRASIWQAIQFRIYVQLIICCKERCPQYNRSQSQYMEMCSQKFKCVQNIRTYLSLPLILLQYRPRAGQFLARFSSAHSLWNESVIPGETEHTFYTLVVVLMVSTN